MRALRVLTYSLLAATSVSAIAADKLSFGPPPSWVVEKPIPTDANAPSTAPLATLLIDQQIAFEPGKITVFSEYALKIQTSQGLGAGNISFPWNPAIDTVTVHKLHIRRGNQIIDVLKSGQTFTVMRREQNLELAMLDGQLTANIQPEGLQVGDVIILATSTEHRDPVMKDHVEGIFGTWNGFAKAASARLLWPQTMKLNLRRSNLPLTKPVSSDGQNILEIALTDVEPLIPPDRAPLRFQIGRLAEASSFASWAEVADLISPLYPAASAIPTSGPLRDEVKKIREASSDPKARTEQALALVQDRVRYVALLMDQGGLVPASAETTWSRRFGDCKAKTALLLGILHELGIKAEPVLVNTVAGDVLSDRLPIVGVFNHVLVRGEVGGKTYWLDGTRSGDVSLDTISLPNFRWGLPLVAKAQLVPIVPPPLDVADNDKTITIDATGGIYAPAPFLVEQILRGDAARETEAMYSALSPAQLDQAQREYWKRAYDYVTAKSVASTFDKNKAELRLTMSGDAKLEWKDGWLYVPNSELAYDAHFQRTAGINRDAPIALPYPGFERVHVEIRLPRGFDAIAPKVPSDVRETIAGVEYYRSARLKDGLFTLDRSERAIRPELPYKEALVAQGRLKALYDDDVHLRVPSTYRITDKDFEAKTAEKPSSAADFLQRGLIYLDRRKYDEAIADFNEAIKLNPKGVEALASRGVAYAWKRDFKSADRDFSAAEALEKGNFVIVRGRGLSAELRGDFAAALAAYDKLLANNTGDSWTRLRRASVRQMQGDQDGALRDIETVIAADPSNGAALAQRAYIMVSREDWTAAEKDIAAALRANPEDPVALTTKAMIATERRDFKTALDLVSKALSHDPDNHYALALQARLVKREGGDQGAMQVYDQAVARAPTDAKALLIRAIAQLEAKNFDAAEKDIAAALAMNPGDPMALGARASLSSAKGDYRAAVETLSVALKTTPANFLLTDRAQAYFRLGEYNNALADTEEALKKGLLSPGLRLLRMNILMKMNNRAAVSTEIDKLVQESPTSEFAMVAAGKAYSSLGLDQKAMESFDRALKINPVPYIYINRAQVRRHSDVQGKLADLDAALKIDPDYEVTLAEKAQVLSKAGRHAEAIELYDRAMKSALDTKDLRFGRAIVLERAGHTNEAAIAFKLEQAQAKTASDFNQLCWGKAVNDVVLESALLDCQTARRLDPKYKGLNESLGMALLKLGRLPDALAAYDKAIAETPGASTYMGRAIVRARLGDSNGAHADAEEARKRRPNIDDTFADYGLVFDDKAAPTTAAK